MKTGKIKKRYIVLLTVLVLLIALAVWQRNNIQALLRFVGSSQEELEDKLQQNEQAIKDAVAQVPDVTIRDVTEEEREELKEGTLSGEELADRLTGKEEEPDPVETPPVETTPPESQPPAPGASPEPTPSATPSPTPEEKYRADLSALIARVYVLREEYLIALDNMQADATAAYKAIPPDERTGSRLSKFVSEWLAKGTKLEKECDQKMDAIAVEMDRLIRANKGDLSIVDTMIYTYAEEKSLKKAWYMSELEKKGLVK